MRKFFVALAMVLTCFLLSSCGLLGQFVMFIPSEEEIGKGQYFEKAGIRLLLTDKFTEVESERGFDVYYASPFCGVMGEKEYFTAENGLASLTPAQYLQDGIDNNGHIGVVPQEMDGLWYYRAEREDTCIYAYAYKTSDAFWSVQYVCMLEDERALKDVFYLWASATEIAERGTPAI